MCLFFRHELTANCFILTLYWLRHARLSECNRDAGYFDEHKHRPSNPKHANARSDMNEISVANTLQAPLGSCIDRKLRQGRYFVAFWRENDGLTLACDSYNYPAGTVCVRSLWNSIIFGQGRHAEQKRRATARSTWRWSHMRIDAAFPSDGDAVGRRNSANAYGALQGAVSHKSVQLFASQI